MSEALDGRIPTNDRIVTPLIPKSRRALGALTATSGLSETDIVNRALQLYVHLDEQRTAGRKVLIHDENGETFDLRWF